MHDLAGRSVIRLAVEDDLPAIRDVPTSVRENHLSLEDMEARGITAGTVRDALRREPCIRVAEIDASSASRWPTWR